MGHQRIGRLPRTRRWAAVVSLLAESPHETARIAASVLTAAERRLDELANETALTHCYWLLTRLSAAAHGGDFAGDAAQIGAPVEPGDSIIGYIARVSEDVADTLRQSPGAGPFAELAVESFRATLLGSVASRGPSLFGSSVDDLRMAFRQYSTKRGFSTLAQTFFGDFVGRTMRYFLDREIANHLGPAFGLATVDDAREFSDALEVHSRETARLVEQFAGDWYSLHNWQSSGEISRREAEGFVAHAMTKLRSELMQEAGVA